MTHYIVIEDVTYKELGTRPCDDVALPKGTVGETVDAVVFSFPEDLPIPNRVQVPVDKVIPAPCVFAHPIQTGPWQVVLVDHQLDFRYWWAYNTLTGSHKRIGKVGAKTVNNFTRAFNFVRRENYKLNKKVRR